MLIRYTQYIHTDISVYSYLIKTFHKFLKLFDGQVKLLCITTTNSILIMGFNFEVEVYFEGGLLNPINRDKNLVTEH